ncbi:MAG: hypothetical protein RR182_09205 [Alistipes sp.]
MRFIIMVKKFSFLDYLFEIWTVATVRVVDISIAFLMFRADMELGYGNECNTGNALGDFDFAGAKALWDALTGTKQFEAVQEFTDFIVVGYAEACELYPDREKLQELVGAWRAKHVED